METDQSRYVDLSQCASIVSRRFYRQGLVWVVAGFSLEATLLAPNSGVVTISKIPSTWCASNAWHKSYAAWQQQIRAALKEGNVESTSAKYRDFKIHADAGHVTEAFAANLIPLDLAGTPYLTGEWEASEIVIPNDGGPGITAEYLLQMVGADTVAAKALIYNYEQSRSVPQSPDPDIQSPHTSFFSEMVDVGDIQDDVVWNASRVNDDLPYNQDDYPGGAVNAPTLELVHATRLIPMTTGPTIRSLPGSTFPCGLIKIDNGLPVSLDIIVHLVPGPSRGYLTQKMQDM
jgi:hypothetical protein